MVDEGQDFDASWFALVARLLSGSTVRPAGNCRAFDDATAAAVLAEQSRMIGRYVVVARGA